MNRRTLVRLLGASAVGALAGCGALEGEEGPAASPNDAPEQEGPTATTAAAPEAEGLVTVTSNEDFGATVDRIKSDIEGSDLTLVTEVDHASNAESAGTDLPPTTLLIFGNPTIGTPLMQNQRSVGIDLPQKMLVWEDESGQTRISYNEPQYIADRHGVQDQGDRIEQMATVLEGLAKGGSDTPTGE